MMTQKTALRSIRLKDVMTSPFSLLTSHRGKICVEFSTGFWQKKTLSMRASCGMFIEKTDEISRTLIVFATINFVEKPYESQSLLCVCHGLDLENSCLPGVITCYIPKFSVKLPVP
jgi:hypothetical protein